MNHLVHLVTTIAVEYVILLLLIRKKPLLIFLFCVLINTFTQPLATVLYEYLLVDFAFTSVLPEQISFIIVEICVVFIESVLIMLLFKFKYLKSLLISVVANLITAILSFII